MKSIEAPVSPGRYYHVEISKAGDQNLPRLKAFDPSEHYVELQEGQADWLGELITCETLKGRIPGLPASLLVTLSEEGEPRYTWKALPPR
jgi:hypothetical protein